MYMQASSHVYVFQGLLNTEELVDICAMFIKTNQVQGA